MRKNDSLSHGSSSLLRSLPAMAAAADDLALAFFPKPGLHLHTMEESAEIWQISFLPQVFWHLEGTIRNTIILTVFKCFKTESGHSKCISRRAVRPNSFRQNREKIQVKNIIIGAQEINKANGYYRMELLKKAQCDQRNFTKMHKN